MHSAGPMPRRSARLAAQAAAACPLLQLDDDVLEVVGHQISDALRPAVAGALAACNHNLWRVMRAPLAKLQPRHAAARALAVKVGYWGCAALRLRAPALFAAVYALPAWPGASRGFHAREGVTILWAFATASHGAPLAGAARALRPGPGWSGQDLSNCAWAIAILHRERPPPPALQKPETSSHEN